MSRTLRTAITATTIALALTACGPNQDEDATPITEAPATETAEAPETPAPEAPEAPAPAAPATTAAATTEAPATTAAPAPRPAAVPTPRPVSAEPTRCFNEQGSQGGTYIVVEMPANDPDGGLVARAFAGTSSDARGVLPEFTVVDTFLDQPEWASCLVAANGSVWWEIGHQSLSTGGWVNAAYLERLADGHTDAESSDEEPDAHADCVIFFGNDECVVVYYVAGDISFVEPYSAEAAGELHLACVYEGNGPACQVLAFMNEGDGIGNSLTQAPTEFLVDDCNNLTGVDQKLACAELATRS